MHIAILTFDGFNELDSLIAFGLLSRIRLLGDTQWQVSIASPTPRVTSMNGLTLDAHIGLPEACAADAVLIGSGMKTREVAQDPQIMSQLQLDPQRQLIAAQCSGTFLLAKLGLTGQLSACTDNTSKPWVQAAGVQVVNQPFVAHGNIATAGGCLSAQYLSAQGRGRSARSAALLCTGRRKGKLRHARHGARTQPANHRRVKKMPA